ncbi:hypothetical protein STEG23_009670 [Scotinomys teguina]
MSRPSVDPATVKLNLSSPLSPVSQILQKHLTGNIQKYYFFIYQERYYGKRQRLKELQKANKQCMDWILDQHRKGNISEVTDNITEENSLRDFTTNPDSECPAEPTGTTSEVEETSTRTDRQVRNPMIPSDLTWYCTHMHKNRNKNINNGNFYKQDTRNRIR